MPAELLHALLVEFAAFERDVMPPHQTPQKLLADLAAGWFGVVLLEQPDGTPMGFTAYSINYSTFQGPAVYMIDLFVREEFRSAKRGGPRSDGTGGGSGGGHGKLLMQFCARLALECGCERLDWHVDGWNDEGKVFYRKQQAAPTGDERWRIARAENGLATFVGTSKL